MVLGRSIPTGRKPFPDGLGCLFWLSPAEAVPSHTFQAVLRLAEQPCQLLMDTVLAGAFAANCIGLVGWLCGSGRILGLAAWAIQVIAILPVYEQEDRPLKMGSLVSLCVVNTGSTKASETNRCMAFKSQDATFCLLSHVLPDQNCHRLQAAHPGHGSLGNSEP